MKKILFLLASACAFGQGTYVPFNVESPPPVTFGSASVIGEPRTQIFYYWIVAKYTSGNAVAYGPITVTNAPPPSQLSTQRYVTISWTAPHADVSGYDILRTTVATRPTGACGCAVATGTSALTVNDQSGTLSAYTVSTASASSATIYLDNRNYAGGSKLIQNIDGTKTELGSGSGTGVTEDQADALAGTAGSPSASNKYVTNDDTRVSAGYVDVVRTSGTVITWFSKCTAAASCTVSLPGGFTEIADAPITATISGSFEGTVYLAYGKDEDGFVLVVDVSAGSLSDVAGDLGGDALDVVAIGDITAETYALSFGAWATSSAATWAGTVDRASPKYPSIVYSSSGGGASSVSDLTDCKTTRTSDTTLTITAPCKVRFGTTVYTLSSNIVVILDSGAGTGTAYVYVDSAGDVYAASDLAVDTCTNCTAVVGTSFPINTLPIVKWGATTNVWDAAAGTEDQRALLATQTIEADTGVLVTKTATGVKVGLTNPEYWTLPLAAVDDGNTAKPAAGVYLGSGHNVSAGVWIYGSNDTAITVPSIYLADAGVGYFRVSRRIPWSLTSLSVGIGITENDGASGDVRLSVRTFCTPFDDSTAADTISYNTGTDQTVTMPAFKKSKMVTFTSSTYDDGCSANSILHVVVYRDPTNGADNYGQNLAVSELLLTLGH